MCWFGFFFVFCLQVFCLSNLTKENFIINQEDGREALTKKSRHFPHLIIFSYGRKFHQLCLLPRLLIRHRSIKTPQLIELRAPEHSVLSH